MVDRAKNRGYAVFVALVFVLCLIPSVGLLWNRPDAIDDVAAQTQFPTVVTDENTFNINYLRQFGDFFETHFAYRPNAIDLNARIRVALVATPPTDQVIVGRDGWLFYGGTLNDYLGRTELSERKAYNIAHNLSLVQGYVESRGAQFVFTLAPNKNSLYPGYMPYYLLQGEQANRQVLEAQLKAQGIHYVNLFELFEGADGVFYLKTDTHWNSEGALMAAIEVMKAVGRGETSALRGTATSSATLFAGDLEAMLFPTTAGLEQTTTLVTGEWHYQGAASSVEDSFIVTSSNTGTGTALMFRDSFGDALIPLMSPLFKQAYYSKLIPYNFFQVEQLSPDYVIIERAERHVSLLAESPPLMAAPRVRTPEPINKAPENMGLEQSTTIERSIDGDFLVLTGFMNNDLAQPTDDLLIRIQAGTSLDITVVPFYRSTSDTAEEASDYGFQVYLPRTAIPDGPLDVTILLMQVDADGTYNKATAIKTTHFN